MPRANGMQAGQAARALLDLLVLLLMQPAGRE
jgi:hypothetical protein